MKHTKRIIGGSIAAVLVLGIVAIILYFALRPTLPIQVTQEEKEMVYNKIDTVYQTIEEGTNDPSLDQNVFLFNRYMTLGAFHASIGEFHTAKNFYMQASEYQPDHSYPYASLFSIYRGAEKWNKAEEYLLGAISRDIENAQYRVWFTDLLRGPLETSDERINEAFQQGIEEVSDPENLLVHYAEFLIEIDQHEAARTTIMLFLKEFPEDDRGEYAQQLLENLPETQS